MKLAIWNQYYGNGKLHKKLFCINYVIMNRIGKIIKNVTLLIIMGPYNAFTRLFYIDL